MARSDHEGEEGDEGESSNPQHLNSQKVNEYLREQKQFYKDEGVQDFRLWQYFQEDFGNWTEDTFKKGSNNLLRSLRDQLCQNGCFVPRSRGTGIATALFQTAQENAPHAWTNEEIAEQIATGTFNSTLNTSKGRRDSTPLRNPEQDRFALAQAFIPNTARLLTDLAKLYNDDDKYGGELYEVLGSKLDRFHDYCQKIALQRDEYSKAFATMLKGEATDYYFDNIVRGYIDVDTHDRQYYTFDEMTNMVKTRFETTEKRQLYMSEWNSLTLTKVIQEQSDKGKSKIQCLELLFSKLRTLQRALGAEYGTDTSVRDKLISKRLVLSLTAHSPYISTSSTSAPSQSRSTLPSQDT